MMTLDTMRQVLPQLSSDFVESYAARSVPWGPIGYVVFKRTYARKHKNRTEEWHETTERCVNNILRLAKGAITLEEGELLFDHVFNLRATFSGRAMWQLGTSTVDRLGGASLTNCWNVSARSLDIFPFMFDMLMLGGGVGFNVQREHIFKLPPVKKAVQITRQDSKDADFIVPDTREGWVELLQRTLDSFFITGKGFTYSTICIRGAGTPISGFGGVASGPDSLCKGMEQICVILRHRAGKQLRSIDVLDICNIIGSIVVAGNVRRSAELALGDPDDFTFLRAKNWANGGLIPNWRAMSNNTIIVNKFDHIPAEFWNNYQPDTGEPYGLFNRNLSRSKGRLIDTHRTDPDITGTNPCSEISLCDFEPCVSGDTRIHTDSGMPRISDVVGRETRVWNGEKWSTVTPRITGHGRELFRVELSDGSYIDVTENHKWRAKTKTEALYKVRQTKELEIGMLLPDFSLGLVEGQDEPDAYEYGLFIGDGYFDGSSGKLRPMIVAGGDKINNDEYADSVNGIRYKKQTQVKHGKLAHFQRTSLVGTVDVNKAATFREPHQGLPDWVFSLSIPSILQFLAGWVDSDGTIAELTSCQAYRIYGSEEKLRDLQRLLRRVGIDHSTLVLFREAGVRTNYGLSNYDLFYLQIHSYECAVIPTRLKKATNFGTGLQTNNAHPTGKAISTASRQRIRQITKLAGLHTTYCFDEPELHMGVFGNCLTYQCNLSEIYLPNIRDEQEFISVATAMYKVCKVITTLPYHWAKSDEIIKKNRRLGLGLTGFMQAPNLTDSVTLTNVYRAIEDADRVFSRELSTVLGESVRESIKLTTIKPSGTASLLAGVSPGIHPEYAPYYLRRVRMSATDALVKRCHDAGYRTERALHIDGSVNHDTTIVEFPIKARKHSILAKDLTAIQMLEHVKHAQTYWSDNAVSCTVYYHESEIPAIQKWLAENYENSVKAVSFLLKKNHGFVQAPLEEITEQEYMERSNKLKPMQHSLDIGGEALDSQECASGSCPIK
jgi:ribonucleotide reductase class II